MEKDWLFYENEARNNGYHVVCGVDEAGRGPLAGPVFAAAVIFLLAVSYLASQSLQINVLSDPGRSGIVRSISFFHRFLQYGICDSAGGSGARTAAFDHDDERQRVIFIIEKAGEPGVRSF